MEETPDAGSNAQPAQPDAPPDTGPVPRFMCMQTPPAGAPTPDKPALPSAGCPTLVPGLNTITSNGNTRQFILIEPAVTDPGEKLPVLFMWHWIGGSAQGFVDRGEIQAAADDQHFIGIVPVAKGATVIGTSFNTRWPFDISQTQSRMNEEFKFFDDMLACVEQQFAVNENCVSTVGVSAGALFNDQLAQARSHVLASFMSLSGGVGDNIIRPWNGAAKKLPGVVLWGGDGPPAMDGNKDILGCIGIGMDFSVASNALEDGLEAGGHFFIECRHNCGHVEPPLNPPPGESKYAGMWEFAFNHPYWLPSGTSPWQDGLPATMPQWCAVGAGNSVPRSGGGCPEAENPCAY
ncbi:MAG TPA: hypothetical protein VL326_08910 [Kofleriaceae bacterium]|nr:hypothetical protein [Kofleriaceae bacterium]